MSFGSGAAPASGPPPRCSMLMASRYDSRRAESTVSNLVEFLENLEFRNVTDDHQLQALLKQARDLLQGVGVEDLRNASELRTMVQQGMASLANELDALMVRTGGRKFRFEDAA
jgi:hypothetical protein